MRESTCNRAVYQHAEHGQHSGTSSCWTSEDYRAPTVRTCKTTNGHDSYVSGQTNDWMSAAC